MPPKIKPTETTVNLESITVRTLVKALTNYPLDTPVYLQIFEECGLDNNFCVDFYGDGYKDGDDVVERPMILLS